MDVLGEHRDNFETTASELAEANLPLNVYLTAMQKKSLDVVELHSIVAQRRS
jgi:hypothetical protein